MNTYEFDRKRQKRLFWQDGNHLLSSPEREIRKKGTFVLVYMCTLFFLNR